MINLITIDGKSAPNFYLASEYHADFKSLIGTVTSGKVMFVSTKFRSDLIYCCDQPQPQSLLKLWSFYAHSNLSSLDKKDFKSIIGNRRSLTKYFQSIHILSTNWFLYRQYQNAFNYTLSIDQQNPVSKIVMLCDQHLIENTGLNRSLLVENCHYLNSKLTKDTFSMAIHMINNESHSN